MTALEVLDNNQVRTLSCVLVVFYIDTTGASSLDTETGGCALLLSHCGMMVLLGVMCAATAAATDGGGRFVAMVVVGCLLAWSCSGWGDLVR